MSWRGYLLTSRRMFPPGEFPCKWMHPFLACRFPAHLTSRNSAPSYRGHSRVNTPPLGRPSCVLTLPLSHDAHMLPSRPEGSLFVISAPARERGTARHTAKRLPIQEPLHHLFLTSILSCQFASCHLLNLVPSLLVSKQLETLSIPSSGLQLKSFLSIEFSLDRTRRKPRTSIESRSSAPLCGDFISRIAWLTSTCTAATSQAIVSRSSNFLIVRHSQLIAYWRR